MNARRLFALGGLTVLGLAAGCFKPTAAPNPKTATTTTQPAGQLRVRADGAGLQLGELQRPSVTPSTLAAKVAEHLAASRRETARRAVLRFPDVAEELLHGCDPARAADPAIGFVAAVLDSTRGNTAWQSWVRNAGGIGGEYLAKRVEVAAALQGGSAQPVMTAALAAAAPAGLAAIDAFRLHGQALLMNNQPDEAAAAFGRAAEQAAADAHQTAQCLLLLGEAQRRAGQTAEGKVNWTRAVEAAAYLLDRPEPVLDPGLWERAAYLKPVDAAWPEAAVRVLTRITSKRTIGPVMPGATVPEAWVWIATGQARTDRGELHAALTAYKRAETMTTDVSVRDGLAVAQARVLLLMGQPQPATGILVPVSDRKGSPHAASALALLGALKLADGAGDQALALLRKAVEGQPGDWPGRSEAEADLGLAYLTVGDQASGLRWLASARTRFAAEREAELLTRSWENEASYWDSLGRATEAATARDHIRQIEAGSR